MRSCRGCLFVLILATTTLAAPIPKSIKKKPNGLEGRWVQVDLNYNGKTSSMSDAVFVIEGQLLFLETNGERDKTRGDTVDYPTDTDAAGAVNWNVLSIGKAVDVYPARYLREGDSLKLCLPISPNGNNRPEDVTPRSGVMVYTFKADTEDRK